MEEKDRFGESVSIVMRGITRMTTMLAKGGERCLGKGEKKERDQGNEFEGEGRKSHVFGFGLRCNLVMDMKEYL